MVGSALMDKSKMVQFFPVYRRKGCLSSPKSTFFSVSVPAAVEAGAALPGS
jgi:hypothetical protein